MSDDTTGICDDGACTSDVTTGRCDDGACTSDVRNPWEDDLCTSDVFSPDECKLESGGVVGDGPISDEGISLFPVAEHIATSTTEFTLA